MDKKNGAELLKECLIQIDANLMHAEEEIERNDKKEARIDIAKARGRIANFLTIMGFL